MSVMMPMKSLAAFCAEVARCDEELVSGHASDRFQRRHVLSVIYAGYAFAPDFC